MRIRLLLAFVSLAMAAGCGSTVASEPAPSPDPPSNGVEVRTVLATMLTSKPLGDVAVGNLAAGETVLAICVVKRAQTNAGFDGSAVRVSSGGLSGFAATTTFAAGDEEPQPVFEITTDELLAEVEPC